MHYFCCSGFTPLLIKHNFPNTRRVLPLLKLGKQWLLLGHQSWYKPKGYPAWYHCHLCSSITLASLMQKGRTGLIHSGGGCGVLGICGSRQLHQLGGIGALSNVLISRLLGYILSCRWLCRDLISWAKSVDDWCLLESLWKISAVWGCHLRKHIRFAY